jgi:hypothetical protein
MSSKLSLNQLNLAIQDAGKLKDIKPFNVIFVEGIIVGILLLVLVVVLKGLFKTANNNLIIVGAGFLFHIVFQILGLNYSYVINYIQKYSDAGTTH